MKSGLWENDGDESIPRYGLFRVTGQRTTDAGQLILLGKRPDGLPGLYLVNKGGDVESGKPATYFTEDVHPLKFDGEDVQVGDHVGPIAETASASPDGDGWTVLRTDEDDTEIIIVRRGMSPAFLLVETTVDHDQGTTEDCVVLSGEKGDEEKVQDADGEDVTIECYNRFADLSAEKQAIAAYVVNGWELIAASCD